jgi:hypothetical protein
MLDRRMRLQPRRARPVVTKRDYELARKLLLQYVRQTEAQRDWERTKALLREVAEYERHRRAHDPEHTVIWAECVFVRRAFYAGPRRRWLDGRHRASA